jgi:hypothetical protein
MHPLNTAKRYILGLASVLFLGATALLACAAKAQPLEPADFQIRASQVGNDPVGVAFDGANIWVTNNTEDTNKAAIYDKAFTVAGHGNGRMMIDSMPIICHRKNWPR